MKIAYFITQHGYGHAVRSAQIMNALPPSIEIIIISAVEKDFFKRSIIRSYTYKKRAFDVGCIQTDSLKVDIKGTLQAYQKRYQKNLEILRDETTFLKSEAIDVVITDSASFPLVLANNVNVPCILLASFTWVEIYQPYVMQYPDFTPIINAMVQEYAKATLHLRPPLCLDIAYGKYTIDVPLIAPKGRNIKNKLISSIGIAPSKYLAMLYLGSYGLDVSLDNLAQYKDWHFAIFEPLPLQHPNYTLLERESWRYEDVVASSDAVIGKLGYGLLSTCMAAGVPVLYPGRTNFVEHTALDEAAQAWGGGISMADEDFYGLNLEAGLEKATQAKPTTVPSGGAQAAAGIIATLAKGFWEPSYETCQ
jgi:L-arabinokinase